MHPDRPADHDRYRAILLFGPPGVGKGTQGTRLGTEDGFVHLATGDIFRSLDKDSPEGREFMQYSGQGLLVPDDLTIRIWSKHVAGLVASGRYDPQREVLVLDGMPRTPSQAEALRAHIEPLGIIHLVVPDVDEMVRRIIKRGRDSGRHDDTDESIVRRRFEEYQEKTAPVIHCYDTRLIHDVDATGTIDEVFDLVRSTVARMVEAGARSA